MSLLDKIDAEIASLKKVIVSAVFSPEVYGTLMGKIQMAERIKEFVISEQKEPCGWCKGEYRFEFNWIDEDGSTVTTGDHMVIGGIADYCPVCGRTLNQPYTE